jgi:hypothetical protein
MRIELRVNPMGLSSAEESVLRNDRAVLAILEEAQAFRQLGAQSGALGSFLIKRFLPTPRAFVDSPVRQHDAFHGVHRVRAVWISFPVGQKAG